MLYINKIICIFVDMDTWYEVIDSSTFQDEMYNYIHYNPSVKKRIIDMLLGKGLWIASSSTRITINRKGSKSNKSGWVVIRSGIFQIDIYQLDDGWFKVKVIEPLASFMGGKRVRFYMCDQEFGVRDLLKFLLVI
jgi:hypothetical protein